MRLLEGTIQRYDWGGKDAIPRLLGQEPDGGPYAEYWLGAHELSPSRTSDGALNELVRRHPDVLGQASEDTWGSQLPFLMKVLSAARPLSLQAHPSREQAEAGFARENAAGIPLDAPNRVYADDWPKPETIIALEEFETLCGFRDPAETARLFASLGVADELESIMRPLTERGGAACLAQVFLDVLSLDGDRQRLIDLVAAAAMEHRDDAGPVGEFARTAVQLDSAFPSDRGILASLLLNRVKLQPGEGLFLAAGQMHAHLSGTGIEVMASSNNVIRGGLTAKHIDVGELVSVVDFEPVTPQILSPVWIRPAVERYPTPCPEFDVWRVRPTSEEQSVRLPGSRSARILLVVDGWADVSADEQSATLTHGQAVFIGAAETDVAISGQATAFLTASGLR
ncbi:MAG: mannose-6-phosphate isomerase, class I [Propionibacteriaceae bacterium]|jgi:mannose-6-phosphate isomerase|nr:mannose-6-phosphate isomerase, class I [Propionibacteriaceae bacterium]